MSKIRTGIHIASILPHLRSPKIRIFGGLTAISYVLMLFKLFGQFFAIESMIYVMLFFLFFHFFYIEIKKLPIIYLGLVMLGATIIQSMLIGYAHLWLIGSIAAINAGIVYLARLLQGSSHEKTSWDTTSYFTTGGYMFTVFITIAYSMFVVGYYEKFPFTCEGLSQASNSVIDFIAKPFKIGLEEVKTLKENTQLFFGSKIGDLKKIEIQNGSKEYEPKEINFIDKLGQYKKSRLDQAIKDNTTINMGICDYILKELNKIYNAPGFKASVIVFMFLLFYGFIRIEFWIMTGIGIILFKILYKCKFYRIKKVIKEVEELK